MTPDNLTFRKIRVLIQFKEDKPYKAKYMQEKLNLKNTSLGYNTLKVMAQANLLEQVSMGYYKITPFGKQVRAQIPEAILQLIHEYKQGE